MRNKMTSPGAIRTSVPAAPPLEVPDSGSITAIVASGIDLLTISAAMPAPYAWPTCIKHSSVIAANAIDHTGTPAADRLEGRVMEVSPSAGWRKTPILKNEGNSGRETGL